MELTFVALVLKRLIENGRNLIGNIFLNGQAKDEKRLDLRFLLIMEMRNWLVLSAVFLNQKRWNLTISIIMEPKKDGICSVKIVAVRECGIGLKDITIPLVIRRFVQIVITLRHAPDLI